MGLPNRYPSRRQAITWTNDDPVQWRIHTPSNLNDFSLNIHAVYECVTIIIIETEKVAWNNHKVFACFNARVVPLAVSQLMKSCRRFIDTVGVEDCQFDSLETPQWRSDCLSVNLSVLAVLLASQTTNDNITATVTVINSHCLDHALEYPCDVCRVRVLVKNKCYCRLWNSVTQEPFSESIYQERRRRNSIADALELRLSCTYPSICVVTNMAVTLQAGAQK